MRRWVIKWPMFYLPILFANSALAQSYLSILDHQDLSLDRRIGAFPNGDILIGDSSIEGLRDASVDGKIFLVRIDHCGSIVWSNTYHQRDVYLELRDVKIADNGNIFVYGSAFRNGFEELIYLLKVSPDGEMEKFNLYRPGTIDHFSYNLDIRNGEILCYGLLLDFDTQKQGFVSIFDEALNFKWGVKFAPFETGGEAIFTTSGNILCRSDAFLFHLTGSGDLIWATELNIEQVGVPLAGPLEVEGGYILQGHRNGQSFFYKISEAGDLIWKSNQVPTENLPADLERMSDGNVYVSYSAVAGGQKKLCHMILSGQGQILQQRVLQADASMDVAETSVHIDGRKVHVVANQSLYNQSSDGLADFLLRFSLDTLTTPCFSWQEVTSQSGHDIDLIFSRVDTIILPSEMIRVDDTRDYWMADDMALEAVCDSAAITHDMQIDTFLDCNLEWVVDLPDANFSWTDGTFESPRTIRQKGTYMAKNTSCSNPVLLTYVLDRPGCDCQIFVPDVITPNGDQLNDELQFFSDCQLSRIEVKIFDRWGREIYQSSQGASLWNGLIEGQMAPSGVYIAQVLYQLVDEAGVPQQGVLTQELHIIR